MYGGKRCNTSCADDLHATGIAAAAATAIAAGALQRHSLIGAAGFCSTELWHCHCRPLIVF